MSHILHNGDSQLNRVSFIKHTFEYKKDTSLQKTTNKFS